MEMGARTAIAWTDATWNPVSGCSHVSPGCDHCYAERMSLRFGWSGGTWEARYAGEIVRLHPERLTQPQHWRRPRRIFVPSMGDLFHPRVPDAFIAQVLDVMIRTPWHTYQVLTKRPNRMARLWAEGLPPHIWVGTTCEDQARAAFRLPALLQVPARVRFVSAEPLLERLDLTPWLPDLQWLIVGAESGPGARPCDVDWVRSLRDQATVAGVPFFLKQLVVNRRLTVCPLLDGRSWVEVPEMQPSLIDLADKVVERHIRAFERLAKE